MRHLITYLLLLFYSVTSTGSTLYLHQCQGQVFVSSINDQEQAKEQSCPLCTKKKQPQHQHSASDKSCSLPSSSCCADLAFSLDSEGQETSVKISTLQQADLWAPVISIRHWMLLLDTQEISADIAAVPLEQAVYGPQEPTFLLLCTFRI